MNTIDKQYKDLLKHIIENGYDVFDNSRNINTKQVSKYELHEVISDNKLPIITAKKVKYTDIIHELLWFIKGDTNIKYLLDNNVNIWNLDGYNYYKRKNKYTTHLSFDEWKSAVKETLVNGKLGKIYGSQWRNNNGIDQLVENILKPMVSKSTGRRMKVSAWNPKDMNDMALPPCHYEFDVIPYFKDNIYSFDLSWGQRSVDTFLGLPYNITSYAILGYIIQLLTGAKFNNLYGSLQRVHIYENHNNAVSKLLDNKETFDYPTIDFSERYKEIVKSNNSFDEKIKQLFFDDIIIDNYKSNKFIKAEMLAPLK